MKKIQDMTAPEIDKQLNELGFEEAKIVTHIAGFKNLIEQLEQDIAKGAWNTHDAKKDLLKVKADKLDQQVKLFQVREAQKPFNAEYMARGGWTRAFLVTNTNGHVHNTTRCGTCFTTTQFAWMTDASGMDEAKIVEMAGDGACTVCYPTAPTLPAFGRKNQFEEPEKAAAREERTVAKAARVAKATATGITNPDGTALRGRWGVIKTERTAQIELVDNLVMHREFGYDLKENLNARIIDALAFKRNQPVAEVEAEIEIKVAAKLKKNLAAAAKYAVR